LLLCIFGNKFPLLLLVLLEEEEEELLVLEVVVVGGGAGACFLDFNLGLAPIVGVVEMFLFFKFIIKNKIRFFKIRFFLGFFFIWLLVTTKK
jgi:hypothetical protein